MNLEKCVNFLTSALNSLKKAQEIVFISKNMLSVLENLPKTIFRHLKSSRADRHQHQKVGAKNWKSVKGVCRVSEPIFLNENKIKEYDAKKPFANFW